MLCHIIYNKINNVLQIIDVRINVCYNTVYEEGRIDKYD